MPQRGDESGKEQVPDMLKKSVDACLATVDLMSQGWDKLTYDRLTSLLKLGEKGKIIQGAPLHLLRTHLAIKYKPGRDSQEELIGFDRTILTAMGVFHKDITYSEHVKSMSDDLAGAYYGCRPEILVLENNLSSPHRISESHQRLLEPMEKKELGAYLKGSAELCTESDRPTYASSYNLLADNLDTVYGAHMGHWEKTKSLVERGQSIELANAFLRQRDKILFPPYLVESKELMNADELYPMDRGKIVAAAFTKADKVKTDPNLRREFSRNLLFLSNPGHMGFQDFITMAKNPGGTLEFGRAWM